MKNPYTLIFLVLAILCSSCSEQVLNKYDPVQIYKEEIVIPTYLLGEPEKNPIFYTPTNYQGAKRKIYPYQNLNKLSDEKIEKGYTGLFLENEYVRLCILPELGGRLYLAQDKTNDYNFIYHNQVIKPALIGMAGAWISGGIEWNIPHHHGASTFMPVDYKMVDNQDGSKTIWVGEYEKRHHTKWMVGLTLHPGKAYVETEIKLFNATPVEQSALIWANPAVHVNEEYQVIFPPDVTKAVYHHKDEFTDWPVSRQIYKGIDFTEGVDVSWWKNTSSPTSFFAWGTEYDFVGGIDHGKSAGTIFVGNRHIFPGKKMWNWGNNEVSRMWDRMLTDEDGPYIEIMMGAYSDNQPDYSWYKPYNMRKGKMFFFPVKGMSGIKNANQDIAINLDIDGDKAILQLYCTGIYPNISAQLSVEDWVIWEEKFITDPQQAISREIILHDTLQIQDLHLTIFDDQQRKLISFSPPVIEKTPHPEAYAPPGDPGNFHNTEDLYLAGLRLEQFGNYNLDPDVYYQEALARDSENIMVNIQVGINKIKSFEYAGAEEILRKVTDKITGNHTSPRMGCPIYFLGLTLLYQDRLDEAYDFLYRATWYHEWASAAYLHLAYIDSRNGDLTKALEHTDRALESNQNNLEAWQLKSILLRKTKDIQAGNIIEEILKLDPLNFVAYYESIFFNNEKGMYDLEEILRYEPDNYLELASRYQVAGFYHDAIRILSLAAESDNPKLRSFPMIHYYLGWNNYMTDNLEVMKDHYEKAANLPIDYCFPHGTVSEYVLKSAINENPEDHRGKYYLGNLYCDDQPERALKLWMNAIELYPEAAVYKRNAAFVLAHIMDEMDVAVKLMNEAVRLDFNDALYLEERDLYYAYMGKPVSLRLSSLDENRQIVEESDGCLARYINLLILNKRFDEALQIIKTRHFHSAEASDINLHVQWADANILMGAGLLKEDNIEGAVSLFKQAMEFPENLESVRDSKIAIALYFLGRTYEKSGDRDLAMEYFQQLVDFESATGWGAGAWPGVSFYKAKALGKTGKPAEAKKVYLDLIRRGKTSVSHETHGAWYLTSVQRRHQVIKRKANGYYMQALGYLGLGNRSRANQMIKQILELDPGHAGATLYFNLN